MSEIHLKSRKTLVTGMAQALTVASAAVIVADILNEDGKKPR